MVESRPNLDGRNMIMMLAPGEEPGAGEGEGDGATAGRARGQADRPSGPTESRPRARAAEAAEAAEQPAAAPES